MMRDKRQKFVDLAESRVTRTIKDIRLIGNLSNRSAYMYSDDDARKIFRAIQKEIDVAKSRFGGSDGGGNGTFRLEE